MSLSFLKSKKTPKGLSFFGSNMIGAPVFQLYSIEAASKFTAPKVALLFVVISQSYDIQKSVV